MMIRFNVPYTSGKEIEYIQEALALGRLSGNGPFTRKCQTFLEKKYDYPKCLLTSSASDALEMAALLLDIQSGDEVIVPSYTFVSTANAFLLRGARIVLADSCPEHPNLSPRHVARLVNRRTKAIVVMHYAGMACRMDEIMEIAQAHNLYVVEDAAQAIHGYYQGQPLGSFGHLSAFSFHESKNINAGEAGVLVINDDRFAERAQIIWEKGTNRSAFFRGEVKEYNWIDVGSSFLPSDLTAAFLLAQLESLEVVQEKRQQLWQRYYQGFEALAAREKVRLPSFISEAVHNAHIFYLLTRDRPERDALIAFLAEKGVQAVFHYLPLHQSPFYNSYAPEAPALPWAEYYGDTLVRLPFYYDLREEEQSYVISMVYRFYEEMG